jgi:hypothetical protein
MSREPGMMDDDGSWLVGVDWASEAHHVRVSDARVVALEMV